MQSSPAFLENQISIICTYWQTSQELQFCKATQSSKPALKWMNCCLQCFVPHTTGASYTYFSLLKNHPSSCKLGRVTTWKDFLVLNRFFIHTLICDPHLPSITVQNDLGLRISPGILLHQRCDFSTDTCILVHPTFLCADKTTKGEVYLALKILQTTASFFPLAIKGTQTG